jgi:hypothetical protein
MFCLRDTWSVLYCWTSMHALIMFAVRSLVPAVSSVSVFWRSDIYDVCALYLVSISNAASLRVFC